MKRSFYKKTAGIMLAGALTLGTVWAGEFSCRREIWLACQQDSLQRQYHRANRDLQRGDGPGYYNY